MMHFKVNDQTCLYKSSQSGCRLNITQITLHKYVFIRLDTSCDVQSGGDDKFGPDKKFTK